MSTKVQSVPYNPSWQQTMIRIKDPKKSLAFYRDLLGFDLIHTYDFPEYKFSLYFLATLPKGVTHPEPGTKEAEQFLWNMPYTCLELTHNHGTEDNEELKYNNGNVEPHRGFGHLAVFTDDVYKACDELEAKGVTFKKKPDEGRMKGLAFAYDPDGYWIEIIKRSPETPLEKYTLSQTMLRVKDVEKSLEFYKNMMGMSLICEKHFGPDRGDFSLYFLASLPANTEYPADPKSEEANEFMKRLECPVIELTHNHGTEKDPNFHYHNGNDEPQGYGHVGFLVDDLDAVCSELESKGVDFKKKPTDGKMRGIAFAYDPDRYFVEIIQRGVSF